MIPLSYYSGSGFINFLISFLVGIIILKNGKTFTHKIFSAYLFSIAFWSFFYFLWLTTSDKKLANFFIRTLMIGVSFIPSFFIHFVMSFLKISERKIFYIVNYLVSFCLSCFVYTNWYVKESGPFMGMQYWPIAGPLFHIGVFHFVLLVGYAFFLMCRAVGPATGSFRNQLLYIIVCTLQAYVGGSLNYFGWYRVNIPPILNFTVSLYIMAMAYAIVCHNLLEIKLVVQKGVIYSFLITAVSLIFFIFAWSAERIFQTVLGYHSVPLTILALSTIVIFFQPLKNRIQKLMDFYFFKGTLESLAEEKQKFREEIRRTDQLRVAAILATGLAHEIKNPLTSIKTFTTYLPEKKDEPGFIERYRTTVYDELDRIEGLVKNLLDFSKPKPVTFEKVDVSKILSDSIRPIQQDLVKRNIKISQRLENVS